MLVLLVLVGVDEERSLLVARVRRQGGDGGGVVVVKEVVEDVAREWSDDDVDEDEERREGVERGALEVCGTGSGRSEGARKSGAGALESPPTSARERSGRTWTVVRPW